MHKHFRLPKKVIGMDKAISVQYFTNAEYCRPGFLADHALRYMEEALCIEAVR